MGDIQENPLPSLSRNQQPLPIDEELWLMAEERAQEILCIIQPNVISEVNRKKIIDHLQNLIGGFYESEVFPFGSVPLKTYLPDGDIDLTVLSPEDAEDYLAQAVCNILGNVEDLEYEVKDIQYIHAQVKVVKCTVKSLAVDISFNQMAGLYALRFLEQVDELVGKNHLFKRSIILIKSWCYYESRILGAHHGLLSTYALEILVLYIINHFHSSLLGPLEVLYRFLDYYSKFDWDKYYVTVDGPQALSSLPEIVEKTECDRVGLLLSKGLLKNYRDMCSVPKASETVTREFPTKFLNILDPLRYDNNLGRSVGKGNLHRIRFALTFGARKLKEILKLPGQSMGAALEMFFMNTLNRNGKGQRADIDVPVPAFGTGKSEESVLIGDCESYNGALQYVESYRNYAVEPLPQYPSSPSLPSQGDMLVLQNWRLLYQESCNIYCQGTTFYNPNALQATYNIDKTVRSRGTGTYIPDMTHNSYRDIRTKVTRPRKFAPVNNRASPRSRQRNQPEEEEVDLEKDVNDNPKPFELSNEDFPILPGIRSTGSTATQESQQEESSSLQRKQPMEVYSRLSGLSVEDFPILPSIHKTRSSTSQEGVHFETDMKDNSRSFNLSNEDFPILPSIGKKTSSSTSQESEQDQHSSSSQMNIEFGTYSIPQPETKLSWGKKEWKNYSDGSSS